MAIALAERVTNVTEARQEANLLPDASKTLPLRMRTGLRRGAAPGDARETILARSFAGLP